MDLYIKGVPPAATNRSTAKLMKTGQTTSYYTNDDGDLEIGRNVNFTTLAENNPFGNTNRFTSTTGTQTYTNGIAIDWSTYDGSTVLGWSTTYVTDALSWNNTIFRTRTIGGFTLFRLPNATQLFSLINFGFSRVLNYPPFNFDNTHTFFTSTTQNFSTGSVYILSNQGGIITAVAKGTLTTTGEFFCRTFTVTGTTLS